MTSIDVNITVDEAFLPKFASVVRAARKAGLKVSQQMKDIGVLAGSIDSDKLEALAKVPGITHVEANRDISIGPPDGDVS